MITKDISTTEKLPENSQVVSKDRVRNLGEVYTAEKEVKAMLDLIGPEVSRLESRVFEPSCGNGNFIIEILRRKLNQAFSSDTKWHKPLKNKKSEAERQITIFKAVSSIYGVDICQQNVLDARIRMYCFLITGEDSLFDPVTDPSSRSKLALLFGQAIQVEKDQENKIVEWANNQSGDVSESGDIFRRALYKLLQKNIIIGNTLTDTKLLFSEWSFPSGVSIQEKVFEFGELSKPEKQQKPLSKVLHYGLKGLAHAQTNNQ